MKGYISEVEHLQTELKEVKSVRTLQRKRVRIQKGGHTRVVSSGVVTVPTLN